MSDDNQQQQQHRRSLIFQVERGLENFQTEMRHVNDSMRKYDVTLEVMSKDMKSMHETMMQMRTEFITDREKTRAQSSQEVERVRRELMFYKKKYNELKSASNKPSWLSKTLGLNAGSGDVDTVGGKTSLNRSAAVAKNINRQTR
jgi:chloramphenicol O-acetyltransferase